MIKDKTFRITYTKSNGETVTRFGKFDDKCRYWTSKIGHALITYFSKKDKKHITRFGKFDDKSKYWTSKVGTALMTYFDLDAKGYRTASGSWKVRY